MDEIPGKIPVGKINSSQISKTIAIEGRINKIYPIKAKLIEGAFRCKVCEHTTFAQQTLTDKLIKPFECENELCARTKYFELIPEKSKWIDERRLELQDPNEQNRDIIVYIRGKDLIDTIPPVDSRIVVTGVLKVIDEGGGSLFDKVLEANRIETIEMGRDNDIIDVDTSKSQKDRIKTLKGVIRELQEKTKSAVPLEDIISKAEESGIKKKTVPELILKLKTVGEILEVTNGHFRIV